MKIELVTKNTINEIVDFEMRRNNKAMFKVIDRLRKRIAKLERLHKIYYEKAHFMRWGTNGEEYSYV